MSFWDKEKSLAQSEPYELHAFWEGDYSFPFYPVLRTTTAQTDLGLTHTTPISDVNDLQDMNLDLSGNYYLTNNIDASATSGWNDGAGFVPIGTSGTNFTGTLDGCGHTISGLTINRSSNAQSLLGYIGEGCQVANLTLSNVNIAGGAYYCGSLVSYAQCGDAGNIIIQNCHSSGTIARSGGLSTMGYFGGMVGQCLRKGGDSSGTVFINDCSSSCTIDMDNATNYSYRGGFVGYASRCSIVNCYCTGSLTNYSGGGIDIGGLVGKLLYSDVSYCYATGDVAGYQSVGGLIGNTTTSCSISNCYGTGDVSCETTGGGGFVGYLDSGVGGSTTTVQNCYSWGDVTGDDGIGGFVGVATEARDVFENCYSVGSVTGSTNVGGFAGDTNASTTFTHCYWDIQTSGQATTDGSAEGKTTQQMYNKNTYIGWDFDSIWAMSDLVENDGLWLYADAPYNIEYNGLIYKAAYMTGEKIEQGTTIIKSRTIVKTNWNNAFAWQYTIAPPSSIIHYKRFRGQGGSVVTVFTGDVMNVEFKQSSRKGERYAEITIEPPRAQLGSLGLISRYSRQCAVELYSTQCGVNPVFYAVDGSLSAVDGNTLTSTTFGTESDGYWNGGYIVVAGRRAKIIDHSTNDITIVPLIYGLNGTETFTIYPGCDHLQTTCDSKFSNLANYQGQPNIPLDNIFDEIFTKDNKPRLFGGAFD